MRYLNAHTSCCLEEVLSAATEHPAAVLGETQNIGGLQVGARSDLVLLDDSLNVLQTYIGGRLVYSADDPAPRKFAVDVSTVSGVGGQNGR